MDTDLSGSVQSMSSNPDFFDSLIVRGDDDLARRDERFDMHHRSRPHFRPAEPDPPADFPRFAPADRPHSAPPRNMPRRPGHGRGRPRPIDVAALRPTLRRIVYIWLRNGDGFWFFPTFVGPRTIAGFRWSRFGWMYTGIDINRIESFSMQ